MSENPVAYRTNVDPTHLGGASEDPGRDPARRIAAGAVKPPARRRVVARAERCLVGAGLTAKDKVTDAEPW